MPVPTCFGCQRIGSEAPGGKGRLNCCLQRPILGRSPSRLNWHFSLKPSLILRQWHDHRASSAMTVLLLKRASASRPAGDWNEDDYDVLADGAVVGRILKVHAAPV